jgi:hypothetical protein
MVIHWQLVVLLNADCESLCREQLALIAMPPSLPAPTNTTNVTGVHTGSADSKSPSSSTTTASGASLASSGSSSSLSIVSADVDPGDIIKRRFGGLYKLLIPDSIAKELKDAHMTSTTATATMSPLTASNELKGDERMTTAAAVPLSSPVTGAAARTMPLAKTLTLPTPSILLDTGTYILPNHSNVSFLMVTYHIR